MTGNPLFDTLISLAGIGLLVVLSRVLRQTTTARIVTPAQAAARLALDEPDFEAGEWVLDKEGRAALAVSADGREIALLRVHGDKLATRRMPVAQLEATYRPPRLRLTTSEQTWPALTLSVPGNSLPPALQERVR